MSTSERKPTYFTKVEDYFNKVDVYSKIVRNNYMFHKEIFSELESFLEKNYQGIPFDFLDLGCGNAYFVNQALKDTSIKSYTAYDLSTEAIAEAKNNAKVLKCGTTFIQGDFSSTFLISDSTKKFDVIWSSFALHHLSFQDKERFFKKCFESLKDNSYLFLVDIIDDFSSRDKCLQHWKESVELKWTDLNAQDKDYLYDHVFNYDFPETLETHKQMAKNIGFKTAEKKFQFDSYAYMLFGL